METFVGRGKPRPNITRSVKSRSRARQGTVNSQDKKKMDAPNSNRVVLTPQIFSRSVMRRFVSTGNISSNASGVVTLVSYGCADTITALGTEWTNFAQEFQEFRVAAFASWFTPSTTNATSVTGPYQGAMIACAWAQLKPTNEATIFQSNQLVKFSTLEEKEIVVNRPATGNALLFNPYGTAVPIDRDFGLSLQSVQTGTLAASSRIFTSLTEMWVEFRTPQ